MQKPVAKKSLLNETGVLLLLGLSVTLFHILTNGQYGFHRDELDILMNARRLDWGFIAYPPVTPLIARFGLELFGNSLRGLRLFSAIGQGIAVVLVGWMARDFGGKRPAQILAALAAAIAPAALTAGTLIQYMSFDYLWWVLLSFFTVRLLKSEDPRYWLGIGAAIGLGMMTKYTMVFFVAGLAAATLFSGARRYLRSPWLWAGAGLSFLIFLPNLLWQVQHDFVSLEFLSAIHARDISWGRADSFLVDQLYITTNPLMLPFMLAGLVFLLFSPQGRRFRLLVWMFLVTFALLWISQGRGYYLAPAYAMLLAAGAVWWEAWLDGRKETARRIGWAVTGTVMTLAIVGGTLLVKPVVPLTSSLWEFTSKINREAVEMIGWPELAGQVADIYAQIPEAEKPRTAILAGNYGEAGAFDLYAVDYGLPPVISGANSLWARGYGNPEPETVIVVGLELSDAGLLFKKCEQAGRVSNPYGVKNEESSRHTGLYVCREPRNSWDHMWKYMQWYQ